MNIIFEKEGEYLFAIAKEEVWNERHHEELMFAEIQHENGEWVVRWEDGWNKPLVSPTLDHAKKYVISNYNSHKPHSNGKSYEL